LTILNKQKLRLFWDFIKIVLTISLFIYTFNNEITFNNFIVIFSVMSAILYLVLHLIVINTLRNADIKASKEL